jgi:hypothetical protein
VVHQVFVGEILERVRRGLFGLRFSPAADPLAFNTIRIFEFQPGGAELAPGAAFCRLAAWPARRGAVVYP